MTADPLAPLGAAPAAPGADAPVCRACAHPHRVTARRYGTEVTYDQACGCGCTASGHVYELGLPACAAILIEHWPTVPRGVATRGPRADAIIIDDPDYDSDDHGAPVGPAGVRLHQVAGVTHNTDRREPDLRGQRALPVRDHDVGSERRLAVLDRGPVRHAGRAEHRRGVDLQLLGLLAVGWGRRLLGRVR